MLSRFGVVLALAGLLAACGADMAKVESDVAAKLRYVCAYSGEFELVAGGLSLIPVPGVGTAVNAAELAARSVCANVDKVPAVEKDVADLIAKFKSVGKM